MSKRYFAIYFLFAGLLCLAGVIYYQFFTVRLAPGTSDYADFKGIILGDSLMYDGTLWIAIKVQELDWESAFNWFRAYPTLLPMTVIVYSFQSLGIPSLVFNLLLILASSYLILQISRQLSLGFPIFSLASLFLNTLTVYFVQSYTKEIILLFLCLCFLYGLLAGKKSLLVLSLLGIGLVRIYFLPPLVACLVLIRIRKRWPSFPLLRWSALCLFLAFLIGPLLIAESGFLIAAQIMQKNLNSTSGISHNYLKFLEYPLVPLFFLPIKIIQNLFEPLAGLRRAFASEWIQIGYYMSVGGAVVHGVLIAFGIIYRKSMKNLWAIFSSSGRSRADTFIWALAIILIISLLMFSALPYVHMRYLYPLVPGFGLFIDIMKSQRAELSDSQSWGVRSLEYERS